MNTIELNCPHCGATIHADEDLSTFNCPCCGSGIILHAQADAHVVKSVPERETAVKTDPSKKEKWAHSVLAIILVFAVICIAGYLGLSKYTDNEIRKDVENVQIHISQKEFPRARTELSSFEGHLLFKAKWENWKTRLEQEIEEEEQNYLNSIKRRVPMSKKDAEKSSIDTVKSLFNSAGFTNIVLVAITDPKENKKAEDRGIKEITVKEDGEEVDFKTGDSLKANAEITIVFYDFSDFPAVPMSANDAKNKDKDDVKRAFEKANFSNIVFDMYEEQETSEKNGTIGEIWGNIVGVADNAIDTVVGFFSNEDNSGKVQGISIQYNGKETADFKKGDRFPIDSKIIIIYFK